MDETFVGGEASNRHRHIGGANKAVVAGAIRRKGELVARAVENVRAETLTASICGGLPPKPSLAPYVSEPSWRYNRRDMREGQRLNILISEQMAG